MNAHDKQKADEAAARHLQDEQDRLVETIGEFLYRRQQRKAQPDDRLLDLRIAQTDVVDLGGIAGQLATGDEDAERIKAAYLAVAESRDLYIVTVADLAAAIVKKLGEIPASEATP